jgi:hypothetical protein
MSMADRRPTEKRPWVNKFDGVLPHQVPAAMDIAKAHGIRVEFNRKGDAIYRSSGARRDWRKLRGQQGE